MVIITGLVKSRYGEVIPNREAMNRFSRFFPPSRYLPSNEGGDGHLLDLGSSAILLSISVGGNTDYLINLGHDPTFWPWALFKDPGSFSSSPDAHGICHRIGILAIVLAQTSVEYISEQLTSQSTGSKH